MARTVKLSRLEATLGELSYPVDRATAAANLDDVTLLLADGEVNLGETVADLPSERFDSPDDLSADLYGALPVEAVGEPGQSEGDA
ncbi:hypothetical protein [Halorarius halobius]|uniref:DUF5789 family protein n=1 Tax=Halorarius halobius TaxID=2962671 RepID=UPI0020CC9848|nr:hypothetical protein [Halorarius halobius]